MENKFKEGQRVRILSKEQLKDLCHQGEDVAAEMFEYGGMEATIIEVRPQRFWLWRDLPEYKLNIDDEYWVWYENLLEPID